jgi:hypothetical protein
VALNGFFKWLLLGAVTLKDDSLLMLKEDSFWSIIVIFLEARSSSSLGFKIPFAVCGGRDA